MRNVPKYAKKRTPAFYVGDSDGLQPGDSIGNRQKYAEHRISADDIGNRLSTIELADVVRDDIGNSIGSAPTHQQSGILAALDGKGRRRRETPTLERRGPGFAIGGVNPVVSGNQALLSMFSTRDDESSEVSSKPLSRPVPSPLDSTARHILPQRETDESRRVIRKNERSGDSSDRWLKRLLELDEEERADVLSTGDPKQKAAQARIVLSEIFEKSGAMVAIGTEIITETTSGRPNVVVSFEDIDMGIEPGKRVSEIFGQESTSLLALNFLVNKIVNRIPEERVRVQVLPRGAKSEPAVISPKKLSEPDSDDLPDLDSSSR